MRLALTLSVLLHAAITGWWLHRLSQTPPELPSRFEVVIQPAAQPPVPHARPRPSSTPAPPKPQKTVVRSKPQTVKRVQAKTPKPRPHPPEKKALAPRSAAASPPNRTVVKAPVTDRRIPPQPRSVPSLPPRVAARFDNPKPWYPRVARRRGMEGRVTLRVTVRPDGRVAAIRVQRSSGYRLLDDAALETVKTWRFVPARRGDTPVTGEVLVPIRFRLRGGNVEMADAGEPR